MAFYGFGKNSGPSFPPKSQTLFGDPQPSPPQPPISQRLGTIIGDPASLPQVSTPQSTSQTPQPVSQRLGTPFGDPPPHPQVSPPTQSTSLTPQSITPQSISQRLGPVFGDPPSRSQVSPLQTTSSTPQPLSQRLGTVTSHAENGSQVLHRAHLSPQEATINSVVDKFHIPQVEGQRSVALSARLGDSKKNPFNHHAIAVAQQNSTTRNYPSYVRNSGNGTTSPSKHAEHYGPKRTRSPPRPASDNEPSRVSNIDENDDEREARAKAKRLARFRVELSKSAEPSLNHDLKWQKSTENKHKKAAESNFNKFNEPKSESNLFDHEKQEQSAVIVGLCEDMCPESERQERERKGDLDQYERFDGERNQTSRSLAVKKYTRTAEREAILIRPMPVLQKTVNYLLELLDQPYDNRFLGMYNFLWDRMRAIRMDLRMQHIFDHRAIIMLEQMIRLHIIAMHELCEYKKGEGFSEGFDAHLNIEQMNKTSVELFQLYDDHRKKGINISTEKEFRGYYALLKLDKHPGYKVEPAELSLDLAKMTPEIRGSQEVLFARAVARACRTGNFIAFFRLARQATYLQACLMHAHFAKLRTQALASLHSGLQNNQGIPITHVVKWLGMEGEDVESLLEYHGFTIKMFEDEYMVKEGLFLNSDVDYPTKCSELVHLKKSENIVDDVLCGPSITASSRETMIQEDVNMKPSYGGARTNILSDIIYKSPSRKEVPASTGLTIPFTHREARVSASPGVSGNLVIRRFDSTDEDHINRAAEEMHEAQDHVTFRATGKSQPFDMPMFNRYNEINTKTEESHQYFPILEEGQDASSPSSGSSSLVSDSPFRQRQAVIPRFNMFRSEIDVPTSSAKDKPIQMQSPKKSDSNNEAESSVSQQEVKYEKEEKKEKEREREREREKEKLLLAIRQKQEDDKKKMKAILRKWKVQAAKKREMREQRQLLANLALSSVPMGPPLQRSDAIPSHSREKIDIDLIMRERDHKQRRSLSRLNIAGVVGPVLMTRHLKSKCLCWKLVACFHKADVVDNISCSTSSWLRSKLMGTMKENNDELVVPSADVSIWKKSLEDFVGRPKPICFSIVREVQFDGGRQEGFGNTVAGGDALLYLVLEGTPLEKQKTHIHNLLFSIPSGSRLPLLILMSGARTEGVSDPVLIINQLDLQDTDKMGISTISVIFLAGDVSDAQSGGFLSDDSLRAGLQWLATQSPLRPSLQLVKTRELVLSYLYSSLEFCNSTKVLDIYPDQCVAIFSEALDKSAKQVQHAASLNSNGWPCPEIDLLEESSINKRILDASLPKSRWSSTIMVEHIVAAMTSCKLPSFSSNLSWLNEGSHMGKYILDQKSSLEELLINYLTQSDTLSGDLAVKEAHLMLQKGAVLEVHDSCYRIVPRWLTIFRRIYNWRLMRLTGEEFATAYVLNNDDAITLGPYHHTNLPIPLKTIIAAQNLENNMVNHEAEMHSLSLDEMIEVACRFFPTKSPPNTPSEVDMESEFNVGPSDSNAEDDIPHPLENSFLSAEHGKEMSPASSRNSSDKLKLLLEQCNMLQNAIEQKLSVYF